MLKISLNYMLNRALSMTFFASWCSVLFWFNMSTLANGRYKELIIMICTILAILLGGMSPKLPETVFLMPVSRACREAYIKKIFLGKLAVAAMIEVVFMIVAVVINAMTPISAVLLVIDTVAISYACVLAGYYQSKSTGAQARLVLGITGLIFIMIFTAGMLLEPDWVALVFALISLVLWCIVFYKPVSSINRMCSDLADYEKLIVNNMPLDKRAKLQEKGVI